MAEEQDFVFELGDTVAINTARYGVVIGRIYYRDADLIRILPQGVSDRLYDFPINSDDGEFSSELGFKDARWISKNPLQTFVEQEDLQAGQYFETFTANGEPGPIFKIKSVNVDDDEILVEDDTGADMEITFGYIGIPLDYPFAVIRVREPPATTNNDTEDNSVGINIDKPYEAEINEANNDITTSADAIAQGLEDVTAAAAKATEALTQGEQLDEDDEFEIKEIGEIIVPVFEQQQIIPTNQRRYPDALQKADALQDFTSMLTIQQQQNPEELRKVR